MANHCIELPCEECGVKYCQRCENHSCDDNINFDSLLELASKLKTGEYKVSSIDPVSPSARLLIGMAFLVVDEQITRPEFFRRLNITPTQVAKIMEGELHIMPKRMLDIVRDYEFNPVYVYDTEWRKLKVNHSLFIK